ncbi:MAG: hypothetical protein ACRD44_06965 [Bryobacteraceae bacterium]
MRSLYPISRWVPVFIVSSWLFAAPPDATTAELKPATIQAFDQHIRATEARLTAQTEPGRIFLWADAAPGRQSKIRQAGVLVEAIAGKGEREVRGGLIHDWVGSTFVPGVTLEPALAFVKNYDNHKNVYQPEVVESRILSHSGNDYKIFMRLMKKKVLTVVLNTEHDVRYFPLDETRAHSRSYTTRIAEVENPATPQEREKPVGNDHGFLWRLYSYWRFQERDGGVWIECQAISLTRHVPTGFGWLITPIIRDLPKESLTNTLRATREALSR